jgi:hypothetical protein
VASPSVDPTPARWPGWRFAAAGYALAVVTGVFCVFGLNHLVGLPHQWLVSSDVWSTTAFATYVANGGVAAMYSFSPWYAALPGFLALYAPVAALGQHLGLIGGYPHPLAHPSMWAVTGPFFILTGATPVLAVDYLAHVLGVSRRRRQITVVVVAVLMGGPEPVVMGHPEDMVALALAAVALARLIQGRRVPAALWLSAAICFQTWAVLLLPVFVAATPRGERLGLVVRVAAVPATIAAALFAFDFHDTLAILSTQPMADLGQPLPWWSLARHITVVDDAGVLHLRAGSTTRWLAVAASVAAAWAVRRRPDPRRLLLAATVALCARGLFEAQYWAYYMIPGAVLLWLLGARWAPSPKRFALSLAGGFTFYASAPMAGAGVQNPAWLALGVLVASVALALGASRPATEVPEPGGSLAAREPPSGRATALAGAGPAAPGSVMRPL